MRKLALAALAVGAIATATMAPAEARWRGGGRHGGWHGVGVGPVWASALPLVPWPLGLPPRPRPTIMDQGMAITVQGPMRISVPDTTDRDIIAPTIVRTVTGEDDEGPVTRRALHLHFREG